MVWLIAVAGVLALHAPAWACGGFFCQSIPIDQAGEQIIFRQDGDAVTAVVLIQYEGDAESFSWVVPVPGIPELSTGSDLVFAPLELATRPNFNLETTGSACQFDVPVFLNGGPQVPGDAAGEDGGGVDVLESLAVGPFAVQVVSSDDADALAAWLDENGYDLTDRGRELVAPYVEAGMNFVALRLQQDQGVGDIQPLIMRFTTDKPMIPIRLTAVAAQPDMGVLVWILGPARAVPLNYLHVIPNYTRLNWYAGTRNAYASYQGLITSAMDEAGGQGFATDYAGRDLDVLSQLPDPASYGDELARVAAVTDDAEAIAELASGFVFPQDKALEILRRELPLTTGEDEFVYSVPELLADEFSAEELAAARSALVVELNDTVIGPLEETRGVLDGDYYLTRLYTTLSPEEMTLDPEFSYNADLGDQSLDRDATLDLACTLSGTKWSLTLGAGTGREGEVVIEGSGTPPGFSAPTIEQDAVWRSEEVSESGAPTVVTQKQFAVARVNGAADGVALCGAGVGQCGAGVATIMLFCMLGLRLMRTRRG